MKETKDSIKIRHLIEQAERLPKQEAIAVLRALRAAVAGENGNWNQVVGTAIKRIKERKEKTEIRSSYRISSRQVTTFVKLFRIVYDLHIFETADGKYASNSEDFICDLGLFFNTEIKHTSNFMDVFDRLLELAQAYYERGDGLNMGKRMVRERQERIDFGSY